MAKPVCHVFLERLLVHSRKSRSLLYNHYKNTNTACSLFA
jgi:hypothetical protein